MNEASSTVYIVDDDPKVRVGLERLLRSGGYQAALFESAGQFLERLPADVSGCLLLDVDLPGLTGLELQQILNQRGNVLPVIFLTGHGSIPMGVKAIKAGAVDFLTKPCDGEALLAAVGLALAKGRQARREQTEWARIQNLLASLTPRERQVLALVAAGWLNKQIAAELGTVEQTVKVHRARVMEKLQAKTLADLVRLAEKVGVRASKVGRELN